MKLYASKVEVSRWNSDAAVGKVITARFEIQTTNGGPPAALLTVDIPGDSAHDHAVSPLFKEMRAVLEDVYPEIVRAT